MDDGDEGLDPENNYFIRDVQGKTMPVRVQRLQEAYFDSIMVPKIHFVLIIYATALYVASTYAISDGFTFPGYPMLSMVRP